MRAVNTSGLITQTERAKASMSASSYAVLLPDPFGPATIQKIGRSTLGGGNVGHADNPLVVAPRLGDILGEYVSETFLKHCGIGIQCPHGLPSAICLQNALFAYGTRSRRGKWTGFKSSEDDLRHAMLLSSTQYIA
jgi:hypothetical protein